MSRRSLIPAEKRRLARAPRPSRPVPMVLVLTAFALTALVLNQSSAQAEMCALDAVPAATLLLPYFEVDLDQTNGATTLFTINNATDQPTLAHVTFWTNWSQPTLTFDLFLTGYDSQSVNLREVFRFGGELPITADEQSDPSDTISPHGTHPEWDGSFTAAPDCVNLFPFYVNPLIIGPRAELLINGHTGQPIPDLSNQCLGADLGDNIARGYITIDHSRRCSLEFPFEPGYFGGADPVALDENRLWGDFMLVNPNAGYEARETLVHIEADPSFDGTTTSSGYTFYGRYSGGADHREPLGSVWGARYDNGGLTGPTTDLLVWRDSTSSVSAPNDGFDCSEGPAWAPLDEISVLCFDEQENDVELCAGEGETCFPHETQRVSLGSGPLAPPYSSGWCRLDLGSDDSFQGDVDFPVSGSALAQSYVVALTTGLSRSGSANAIAFAGSCEAPESVLDLLFADDFETGDATTWTSVVP